MNDIHTVTVDIAKQNLHRAPKEVREGFSVLLAEVEALNLRISEVGKQLDSLEKAMKALENAKVRYNEADVRFKNAQVLETKHEAVCAKLCDLRTDYMKSLHKLIDKLDNDITDVLEAGDGPAEDVPPAPPAPPSLDMMSEAFHALAANAFQWRRRLLPPRSGDPVDDLVAFFMFAPSGITGSIRSLDALHKEKQLIAAGALLHYFAWYLRDCGDATPIGESRWKSVCNAASTVFSVAASYTFGHAHPLKRLLNYTTLCGFQWLTSEEGFPWVLFLDGQPRPVDPAHLEIAADGGFGAILESAMRNNAFQFPVPKNVIPPDATEVALV